MLKRHNNTFYLFAVAMVNSPSQARFTLNGLNAAKVIVVGEARSITPEGGAFEDSFDGYGVHIYQITPIASGN